MTNQLWLVAVGMFACGISFGGGQLAWQLGQNAFATKDNVGTYMGLHVMLTGLRGMFAPFLGVGIYHTLSRFLPAGIEGVPGGRWVFAVSVMLATIALVGYIRMSRRYGNELAARDEETPAVSFKRGVAVPVAKDQAAPA